MRLNGNFGMNKAKNFLLTGATGFLGSHILESLIQRNHNVTIIKRSFSNTWRIEHILSQVQVFDVDRVSMVEIFKKPYNAIINTATQYGRDNIEYSELVEANMMFPLMLLDAAKKNNTPVFINAGSFIVRSSKYKYLQAYSLAKRQLTDWLHLASKNIKILNLQLEHIYGSKDSAPKFVPYILSSLITKKDELQLTGGEQQRDFIYCEDAAEAFIISAEKSEELPYGFNHFEVGSGKAISIKDFVLLAKELAGSPTRLKFGELPYRKNEIMSSQAITTNLNNLGWAPKYSLHNGLMKTIEWYKKDLLC